MVRRHFDPETGAPYWLRRARELSFDPRDITRYEELAAFGPFPTDRLRRLDVTELVPLTVRRPLACHIWETGGTTGDPCRVIYTRPMLELYGLWRSWMVDRFGFRPGRHWLRMTPSGPHLIGHCAWLTDQFDSRLSSVDLDPRWVKRLIRAGRLRDAQEYTDHVLDQAVLILRTQPVDYLLSTPALFQALVRRVPDLVGALRGVLLGGTHATAEMWRSFVAAVPGGPVVVTYGNTFGGAVALPAERDGSVMPQLPTFPQVTMAVVDRADWTRTVHYGEYGQLRLTVMHEDLFLPNVLERDLVLRYDTGGEWPCDGIANVRPLQDLRVAPEGVY